MKFFLLLGGFFGFFVVFASGVSVGNDLTDVLRNATIGCMCGALLMRGFRMLLVHQIRQAASEQERLATEAATVTQE
jgi:hypothetical protein